MSFPSLLRCCVGMVVARLYGKLVAQDFFLEE